MLQKIRVLLITALIMISIVSAQSDTHADTSGSLQNQTIAANISTPDAAPVQISQVIQADSTTDSSKLTCQYPSPYFFSGDAIKISVYPDSALFLNGFYMIDQNGCVDLPILGLVSLRNKTRSEFIDLLKEEYSEYLRYPNINVTSYMRVAFFGGFFRPGLYWVESRNSLWEAIQLAGGVSREDGMKKIRWERDGSVVSNNIITDFQKGTSLSSMGFKSGDQLCVTSKPKLLFWESFRQDVIPILSFSLTAFTAALTAYQTYKIVTDE